MARYALNLPAQLKQDAEKWAAAQGVSLNQFIQWAVAEKVGALSQQLDDPEFPQITYRRGAGRVPQPVIRGSGVRVQTVVTAAQGWQMPARQIAGEYGLEAAQVEQALAFYAKYPEEIDLSIRAEQALEAARA